MQDHHAEQRDREQDRKPDMNERAPRFLILAFIRRAVVIDRSRRIAGALHHGDQRRLINADPFHAGDFGGEIDLRPVTPDTRRNTRSTRPTQEAQVIPSMPKSTVVPRTTASLASCLSSKPIPLMSGS